MKRVLVWVGVAFIVFVGGLQGFKVGNAFWDDYKGFKETLSGLKGIKFGTPPQEVLYTHGRPSIVRDGTDGKSFNVAIGLPNGSRIEDFTSWSYLNIGEFILNVEFDPTQKSVRSVQCMTLDRNDPKARCVTVAGVRTDIYHHGSEDYIVEKLGKPDSESYREANGGHLKFLNYDTLGLSLVMEGRQLITINQHDRPAPSFLWWLQHGRPTR